MICMFSLFATIAAFQGSAFAQQWGEVDELKEFLKSDGASLDSQRVVTNANLIEVGKLMEGGLSETPWSSDFWPDMKGSIADPYNETGQGSILGSVTGIRYKRIMWTSNRDNLIARKSLHEQVVHNINSIPEDKYDNMSPSEKYDMLMGDVNFTMTNNVVQMVEKMDSIGLVAAFSGVCHGWSPASLEMPRPEHVITVMSPFGRKINFYPMDLKALASFLWGKSDAANLVHFEGTKCYSGGKTTSDGRLVDPKCFNVNPAQFHLVAVNQIGVNHHGFIIDRSDNGSVWNQPVYAYRAKYFKVTNPQGKAGLSFQDAKVVYNSSASKDDDFRDFRSPKTSALVGVEMTFWYSKENMDPDHTPTDSPSNDHTESNVIRYDLELDAQDNIVGGEWREYTHGATLFEQVGYTHPNSIWLVPPGITVTSPNDADTLSEKWDGTGVVPKSWRDAAAKYWPAGTVLTQTHVTLADGTLVTGSSAATTGMDDPKTGVYTVIPAPQALAPVVNALFELSRKK